MAEDEGLLAYRVGELEKAVARAEARAEVAENTCTATRAEQDVVISRMDNMIDAYRAQRNALYSAAGALALLGVGIILRVLGVVG